MKKKNFIILLLVCLLVITGCQKKEDATNDNVETNVSNPHAASWIDEEMASTLNSIKRVDEKGVLYEMDYTANYYGETIKKIADAALSSVKAGCSAFTTYNTSSEYLFCRNYDYRHKDSEGNYTGLNVVLNLAPEGKLKSINVTDAYWLNPSEYYGGVLDDGITDTSSMILAPYACVDGMNEAGVSASLLVVDTKENEEPTNQNTGKEKITHSILLRYIIDNAHNLEEAIEIAKNYDIYSSSNQDLHMIVSDSNGNSAVFEWRKYGKDSKQELYVTYTNAVTNFLVGFTDGENVYNEDGTLKELYSPINNTVNNYKYGYGHGYHRFNGIVSALERYILEEKNTYGIRNSQMEESQALDILRVASQNPGTEKTSFTQYSAIYNLKNKTVKYYVQRDYDKSYEFSIK